MPPPLVSLLIPVYNAAPWLEQTLQSALAQQWPHCEIIVVDDGSRDESVAVARRHAGDRVRVFTQANAGAAAARNHALREARGDYLQYLDADDLLAPDKIAAQMTTLLAHPPGCVGICGTVYFDDGEDPEAGIRVNDWTNVDTDDPADWLIRLYGGYDGRGGMVHPGAWLTPRAVAEQAGRWDETLSPDDDGEYFSRVVLASRGLRRTDVYSYYRKHRFGSSLSSARGHRLLAGAMYSLDRKAEQLLARTDDPRARRGLARCYLERAVVSYPDNPAASDHGIKRARELDPACRIPSLGGKSEVIRRVLGWKAARRFSVWRSRLGTRPPS
jgi:glycosyltransferase involved in cell wall biosynthesis